MDAPVERAMARILAGRLREKTDMIVKILTDEGEYEYRCYSYQGEQGDTLAPIAMEFLIAENFVVKTPSDLHPGATVYTWW